MRMDYSQRVWRLARSSSSEPIVAQINLAGFLGRHDESGYDETKHCSFHGCPTCTLPTRATVCGGRPAFSDPMRTLRSRVVWIYGIEMSADGGEGEACLSGGQATLAHNDCLLNHQRPEPWPWRGGGRGPEEAMRCDDGVGFLRT